MSRVSFLDSSAIYPLANRNDFDHAAVAEAYLRSGPLVTHDAILLEAFSLIAKRIGKHAAIQVVTSLRKSDRISVVALNPALLEAGWRRCMKYRDKEWDWIDSISFEIMENRGIRDAISLDHHFEQAGFNVRPHIEQG